MIQTIDYRLTRWFQAFFSPQFAFWGLVSRYGLYVYALILLALGYLVTHKLKVFFVFLSVAVVLVLVTILKYAVKRKRPSMLQKYTLWDSTSSFPSGHASMSFAFAVSLSFVFLFSQVDFAWVYVLFFLLFAIAISISRIIVGVHYVSDVIVGVFLGSFVSVVLFYYLL